MCLSMVCIYGCICGMCVWIWTFVSFRGQLREVASFLFLSEDLFCCFCCFPFIPWYLVHELSRYFPISTSHMATIVLRMQVGNNTSRIFFFCMCEKQGKLNSGCKACMENVFYLRNHLSSPPREISGQAEEKKLLKKSSPFCWFVWSSVLARVSTDLRKTITKRIFI